jgi:hypothetical protein
VKDEEQYYLKLILNHIPRETEANDLKIINDILYQMIKAAVILD